MTKEQVVISMAANPGSLSDSDSHNLRMLRGWRCRRQLHNHPCQHPECMHAIQCHIVSLISGELVLARLDIQWHEVKDMSRVKYVK